MHEGFGRGAKLSHQACLQSVKKCYRDTKKTYSQSPVGQTKHKSVELTSDSDRTVLWKCSNVHLLTYLIAAWLIVV